MLSVEHCEKYFKDSDYEKEEIENIRESLYQFAEILVGDYIERNKKKKLSRLRK